MKRTLFVTVISMILITLLISSPVLAHRMLIVQDGNESFVVQYDDGTAAAQATVYVYDDQGEVLLTEQTDSNGSVSIPSHISYSRIVATDGMGHQVTWVPHEQTGITSVIEGIPLWARALLGCSLLIFIAALFRWRTNTAQRSASKV